MLADEKVGNVWLSSGSMNVIYGVPYRELDLRVSHEGVSWQWGYLEGGRTVVRGYRSRNCSDDLKVKTALLFLRLLPAEVYADCWDEEMTGDPAVAAFLREWAQLRAT